jgi:phage gp29-like protein
MNLKNFFNPAKVAAADTKPRQKTRPSQETAKKNVDRVKMEMKTLIDAAESAKDVNNPDNRDLITIYENTVKDPHVHSQLSIARSKITGTTFTVIRNGKEDEAAKELFMREWFEKFVGCTFDAEMWGYMVIEFGQFNEAGEFIDCKEFPKRHIIPQKRSIAFSQDNRAGDLPYADATKELFLVELGNPDNLGTLELIAREVIWKNFARSDWSQSSERFGSPILYIKSDVGEGPERDRLEAMMKNFASNGYVLTDIDDEVQIIMPSSTDYYKIYSENARFCDEQISKCINGQTGSSDEESYVGSAEVHERILDDFNTARLRRCQNVINNKLIPFLIFHGYPLDGCQLSFIVNNNNSNSDEKKTDTTTTASGGSRFVTAKAALPGEFVAGTTPW